AHRRVLVCIACFLRFNILASHLQQSVRPIQNRGTMAAISETVSQGFRHYFHDFLARVEVLSSDLLEDQFWANPLPYVNSIGHLVLHITGNLNYYIGAQLAGTGYIRDREREFTESNLPSKAETLRQLALAIELVLATLEKQREKSLFRLSHRQPGMEEQTE